MIFHNSLSYILMIITLPMQWRNMSLTTTGWKEDTDIGNTMKKDATKIRGSIDPRDLIKTRNFITVMIFPGLIHRQGLASCNIKTICTKYSVDWCVCIPSILYFTWRTHFCDCFLRVPLINPCSNTYVCSAWNFDLVCFCWLFEFILWHPYNTA